MSFDAFGYSKSHKAKLTGETQDDDMSKLGAFEILSFDLGALNTINIGSISGGGGAGKASFKPFVFTKKTDTASTGFFQALVTGEHFDDFFFELRRSAGSSSEGKSGKTFLKVEFRMVMVAEMVWNGAHGDDVCEETLTLEYGAIQVQYFSQDKTGKMADAPKEVKWSRVKNNASLTV
jgi:type VI secretion system secreted protein Hcp